MYAIITSTCFIPRSLYVCTTIIVVLQHISICALYYTCCCVQQTVEDKIQHKKREKYGTLRSVMSVVREMRDSATSDPRATPPHTDPLRRATPPSNDDDFRIHRRPSYKALHNNGVQSSLSSLDYGPNVSVHGGSTLPQNTPSNWTELTVLKSINWNQAVYRRYPCAIPATVLDTVKYAFVLCVWYCDIHNICKIIQNVEPPTV